MNRAPSYIAVALTLVGFCQTTRGDDFVDRIDDYLATSAFHGNVRVRVSGIFDLEGYYLEKPAPGLIFTDDRGLLNPRLSLFLDAQIGTQLYLFAQARVDRGFDPSDRENADVRLDEYAIRVSPWDDGCLSAQVGRFSTIVGNWVPRHLSWDNPFITAPVPYENVTGIWDSAAPNSVGTLLNWGHLPAVRATNFRDGYSDKYLRNPIIWGPSYATGAAVFGRLGELEYAAELKNASLSSRPESWDRNEVGFEYPTFSTRLGFRPNPTWNFGFSTSTGAFLLPEAQSSLPTGRDVGDYRQLVLAQDVSFEWHRLQVWVEFYEARFEVPNVGDADTFAYYVEGKYKFTPQLFGALRWNQQLFDSVPGGEGVRVKWGNDLCRIDAALGYRFSPHTQIKLQYSIERSEQDASSIAHNLAGQLMVKF